MKYRYIPLWFSLLLSFFSSYAQQSGWPAQVQTGNGSNIKVYEPQPESFSNSIMKIRAAVSVLKNNQQDPVFGVIWADVRLQNSDNNTLYWKDLSITNFKLPGEISDEELNQLKAALETGLPSRNISISQAQLTSQLNQTRKESELSSGLSTRAPRIIYTKKPSVLVTIDGAPQLQQNPDWGVEQVVNTPFTIIKNTDQQYYLYSDKKWYRAVYVTGTWSYVDRLPSSLSKINSDIQASDTSKENFTGNTTPDIVVSTEPAELIQSDGEANFSPVEGTSLLYMTNTVNDIFLDVDSQQYYVLVSGRWYKSTGLSGSWLYVPSTSLPQDFSRIPEGSAKDGVLANVAGTDAASDAVADAQLPQTAKVDRRNATANVTYDGEPQFESIDGTRLKYAVNTPATVLNQGRQYYSVENGVWFESYSPNGPWTVATQRPAEVDYIPASYPVYNTKYVYIYDVTPDYVYTGYTPGYLGTYVYGPTIFYGTGYYYRPWRGRHYYPRPVTWGYNMRYNPWYGWGLGINLNFGIFNINIGNRYRSPFWGSRGGWFGPSVYCPSYYRSYGYNYGSRVNSYAGNRYRSNYSNNIYTNRRGVVTYERPAYAYNRSNYNNNAGRPSRQNNDRYNNPNGYNNTNTNRNRQGDVNSGRRDETTLERPSRTNSNRLPGQQQNNGMTNRLPDNRVPENRLPGQQQNNGMNNRLPERRQPIQQQNNGINNRLPEYNNLPGNRVPDNVNGNRSTNNLPERLPRQYQPQPQSQPNNMDNNRNAAPADRSIMDRRQRTVTERNNQPQQRPVEQQPQVREREADRNSGNQRQSIERPQQRPERNYNPVNNNNSGSSGQMPERNASRRRGG